MKLPENPTYSLAREARRFGKAQVSAVTATGVEWLCIWALVALGTWYVTAALAGAISGALTDFLMKKYWVFETAHAPAFGEMWRYALVSGASAGIFSAAVYMLVDHMRVRVPVAVVISSIFVGIAWNYPLHRLVVFRHGTPEAPQ